MDCYLIVHVAHSASEIDRPQIGDIPSEADSMCQVLLTLLVSAVFEQYEKFGRAFLDLELAASADLAEFEMALVRLLDLGVRLLLRIVVDV